MNHETYQGNTLSGVLSPRLHEEVNSAVARRTSVSQDANMSCAQFFLGQDRRTQVNPHSLSSCFWKL